MTESKLTYDIILLNYKDYFQYGKLIVYYYAGLQKNDGRWFGSNQNDGESLIYFKNMLDNKHI